MDKIQAAIAKARAARNGFVNTGAKPKSSSEMSQRRIDGRSRILRMDTQTIDRSVIWQPLATFAPSVRQMARHRIVTSDTQSHNASGAAAFDILRTKVLQQMRTNGWKRLAITSPGSDCGKTTVAMNLAFSFSKQPEINTIVAEMDMRRPSMAKILGLSGNTGFAAVLDGQADFADAAMRPRNNLAFGLNYERTRNPSELLQSSRVGRILGSIEERFMPDLTIFDMPPMLHSDDTMAFMGQVDCVLLVAAAESTSLREVDICESDLAAQTNVMGVLLNKCRYIDKESNSPGGYY